MQKNDKLIAILGVVILILASIGIYFWAPESTMGEAGIEDFYEVYGSIKPIDTGIKVSDENPFFALITTPLAINYEEDGEQNVLPLYVTNFDDASKAIVRAESEQIQIEPTLVIQPYADAKQKSIEIASSRWEESEGALLIEQSQEGYNLGVVATPLASYLSIPVIVTDAMDEDVIEVLNELGVKKSFVCGNLSGFGTTLKFENVEEIVDMSIDLVKEKFGRVNYLTITNPQDTVQPEVLDTTEFDLMEGTVSSFSCTPTNLVNVIVNTITKKAPLQEFHLFDIPDDYKYCRIKVYATHEPNQNPDTMAGKLAPSLLGPDSLQAYLFTAGGIPERDENGNIVKDQIYWETVVYDQGGEEWGISVGSNILTAKTTDYEVSVVLEELASPYDPRMPGLSSIAPYLTAYRKGVVFAKPEFAFAADEERFSEITSSNKGVVWPGANPTLTDISNEHTFEIHEQINMILADIAGIEDFEGDHDTENLEILKEHYDNDPIYVGLVGSAEMIPQYYYYDTPDANSIFYGWDVASDFIYGNIDPYPRNDKVQNNHPADKFISKNSKGDLYEEHYPYQENLVGRVSGWDVQDVSALIVRTIFYENIINNMDEDWKNTANVQTGSGTDFQRVPGFDLFRKLVFGIGEDELVMKWPTGEAHFENMALQEAMETGKFSEIISTENQYSAAYGLSMSTINKANKLGLLNRLLFPKWHIWKNFGEDVVHGAEDQTSSNFIFSFGHGQPMGYEHADVQGDSVAFRPILLNNLINRITFATGIPAFGSGIPDTGSYNVRTVTNLDYGPSVVFIESCYVGRIDAWYPKANAGQAYLHSGVNALVASSRGTPGPGYLDARQKAVGFGLKEYLQTKSNPELFDLHFSGLYASNVFKALGEEDATTGLAFRNARNMQWEDADASFFWAPPLSIDVQGTEALKLAQGSMKELSGEGKLVLEKKYTCQLEYNLFGDPAFDPYTPSQEGRFGQ